MVAIKVLRIIQFYPLVAINQKKGNKKGACKSDQQETINLNRLCTSYTKVLFIEI